MDIGRKIKNAREKKNFTQAQLGEIIGVTKSEISHYEHGVRFPRTSKLRLFAEVLDLPIEFLLEADTEEDRHIRWGYVRGAPREVVYIPLYRNPCEEVSFVFDLVIEKNIPVVGSVLPAGYYIWFVGQKTIKNRWNLDGIRLLVNKTKEICEGDTIIFQLCDEKIWLGEVILNNQLKEVFFYINNKKISMPINKIKILGKVVQLALDI